MSKRLKLKLKTDQQLCASGKGKVTVANLMAKVLRKWKELQDGAICAPINFAANDWNLLDSSLRESRLLSSVVSLKPFNGILELVSQPSWL